MMSTMRRSSKTVIDNEQRDFLSDVTDQTDLAAYCWQLQRRVVKGREKKKELQVARLAAVMKLQRLYFPGAAFDEIRGRGRKE